MGADLKPRLYAGHGGMCNRDDRLHMHRRFSLCSPPTSAKRSKDTMISCDDPPESSDDGTNSAMAPTNIPSQRTPNIAILPLGHLLSMLPY